MLSYLAGLFRFKRGKYALIEYLLMAFASLWLRHGELKPRNNNVSPNSILIWAGMRNGHFRYCALQRINQLVIVKCLTFIIWNLPIISACNNTCQTAHIVALISLWPYHYEIRCDIILCATSNKIYSGQFFMAFICSVSVKKRLFWPTKRGPFPPSYFTQ